MSKNTFADIWPTMFWWVSTNKLVFVEEFLANMYSILNVFQQISCSIFARGVPANSDLFFRVLAKMVTYVWQTKEIKMKIQCIGQMSVTDYMSCDPFLDILRHGMDIRYEFQRYLRWTEPWLMTHSWPSVFPQGEGPHIQPLTALLRY